jgi:hypothetical protein
MGYTAANNYAPSGGHEQRVSLIGFVDYLVGDGEQP